MYRLKKVLYGLKQASSEWTNWLCSLMNELKVQQTCKWKLLIDNKSGIDLTKHPASHGRSKLTKTRFHYIHEQVPSGKLIVEHCRSEVQLPDIITKALKYERFKFLKEKIGVFNVFGLRRGIS